MDIQIIIVFIILGVTIALFVTEFFEIDKIAFLIIITLALLNLTTPEEAISGFSNPAVITILALMILAIGLEDNGVIQWLTQAIKQLKILPLLLLTPAFMIVSAGISAFISTTAVVIIFIKIISQLAERYNFSSSKLLIPISFAGILGGSCTLMGTSTNLLVNSIAKQSGIEAFSFFEFTFIGLGFLTIGVVYITLASKFLPKDKPSNIEQQYDVDSYVFTVRVTKDSKILGEKLGAVTFLEEGLATPLKLMRNHTVINAPGKYVELKQDDNLVLMSTLENVTSIAKEYDLVINDKLESDELEDITKDKEGQEITMTYVELLILPGSKIIGHTLRQIRQMSLNGAYPIAVKKRRNIRNTKERLLRKNLNEINIKPGDRLLVELQEQKLSRLHDLENIAILNQHDYEPSIPFSKKISSFIILIGVIALAASGVLSILSASLTGVATMLLFKLISLENIYHRVNWQIIFLLAGMIPLGIAMSNSGTDVWISTQLIKILQGQSPIIVIGLIFGITMLLSGFISNNATAIIMTPIAIAMATGFNLDVKPFLLSVLFAANFSFFTPVGYQTNTLIYSTGLYKFKHFAFIGGGLSLILWIAGTFMLSKLL